MGKIFNFNVDFKPDEENADQYIYRICSMKESSELTWKQIADIINKGLNNNYDESAYRKKYQNFQNGLKTCEKQIFADDEYLKSIREKTDELYKAKKQFQDQRREYYKNIANDARFEHIKSELIDAANKLNSTKSLNNTKELYLDANNEAVLCLSDWHFGLKADNVWNEYNIEICINRVNTLFNKAKNYLRVHNVNNLHIMILGDIVHGSIHTSARVASEEFTCDQLMNVSELLAEFICGLSEYVNEVHVYSTYGNHARTIQKKEDSIHRDNMERIVPWWLKYRLKDNDKVYVEDNYLYEFIYVDVCGHDVIGVHGDLENFKKLGIDMHTLFSKKYNLDVEYVFSGDKHHFESNDHYGIDNVMVSSLCGTDEYANGKRLYSKAGQTLCIFNKEDGKVCTYNITF